MIKFYSFLLAALVAAVFPIAASAQTDSGAELSVTPDVTYDGDIIEINSSTPFASFAVAYKDLPSDVSIWIGGKDRAMFAVSQDVIAAGSGETTVYVTYQPTAPGIHSAMVNFDSTTETELSSSFAMRAMAYDPAKPPTISVQSEMSEFNAKVGETMQQTFSITSKDLLDYGKVQVDHISGSAFRINSTMVLKNGTTNVTVTFAPTEAGEYESKITVSALKADPIVFTLKGIATGSAPVEEKEGDELTFDTTAPLAEMTEDFSSAQHNKPLGINGWRNVAVQGTRAWWGYTRDGIGNDIDPCAKVTGYQRGIESGATAEMMLLTPALDYANANVKTFCFSVKAEMIPDGYDGNGLEIYYIDLADGEPFYQLIEGLDIPVKKDDCGDWRANEIHLEDADVADTFFIGFRFATTRDANSPVYYLDNVSWGVHSAGIESATSPSDGIVRWFNLQGVEVANPKAGVHIRLQNGIANKVLVK